MRKFIAKRRIALTVLAVGVLSAVFVGSAGATAPVVPAIPVATYGDSLLSGLATAVTDVFPYAAAITAFAIGVGLVRRWLGHKRATRV